MPPRTVAKPQDLTAPHAPVLAAPPATITPDLAAVLHDARPGADADLAGLLASYLLPPGTRARVHRTGPGGVLLLAPASGPRAVAAAGPGVFVVVESSG